MSGGRACRCSEKTESLVSPVGSNRPTRLWRVIQRRCNHSAFNGYHETPSEYSSITCLRCGAVWRTKAEYQWALPNREPEERDISCGISGHATAMEARGRTPHENDGGN